MPNRSWRKGERTRGIGIIFALLLTLCAQVSLAAAAPARAGGFVFWRKASPAPQPPTGTEGPAPPPAEAPVAQQGATPTAAEPAPAARAVRSGDALAALEAENAQLAAQVAALEQALEQAQKEVTTLQAKLQAILTVPQAAEPERTRVYRVQEGDTLYTIAQQPDIYADGRLWKRIYEANRHTLSDPERLQPGQQLSIPR